MDTAAFLRHLESQPAYNGQVAHIEHIVSSEASYAELDAPLVGVLPDYLTGHCLAVLDTH